MYSQEQRKKAYEKRKARGVCVWCGKPARPGKVQCEECAERARETKEFYRKLGFCPICHKYRIYGDEKECPECRARRLINNRLSAEKARAEGKAWTDPHLGAVRATKRYERLKSEGLCVKCGKHPSAPGKTLCRICLDRAAYRQREYRYRLKEGIKGTK